MGTFKKICIHETDTPPNMFVDKNALERWHKGPRDLPDGSVRFLGETYQSRIDLPDLILGGRPVNELHGRGWDRLGYYLIIHRNGKKEILTPNNLDSYITSDEMTWGAKGINSESIHIVLEGGWKEVNGKYFKVGPFNFFDIFTDAQYWTLELLLKEILGDNPTVKVLGHYQVPNANKTCPNFLIPKTLKQMLIPQNNIY